MATYSYTLSECDVLDKPKLQAYRDKRAEWVLWLSDDPDHGIWQTITAAVWREVSFSTLAKIAEDNPQGALNNSLVGEAVLDGHVALQILAIRRLADDSKNVISVTKLLQNIRSNIALLTRENYVSYDGLPYDYKPVADENFRKLVESGKDFQWGHTTGPLAASSSEMAHRQFDRLTGVSPDNRKRDDRISRATLDVIEKWIEDSGAHKIAKWSSAYLAHGGSVQSREALANFGLTGAMIGEAIRGLAKAAEAISAYVLYDSGRMNALMATPQYDQFEHLEKPALKAEASDFAFDHWSEQTRVYDTLVNDVGDLLEANAKTSRP